MKKNSNSTKRRGFSSTNVPVIFKNGAKGMINTSTIPEDQWDHHHGVTAGGIKVNSLQTTEVDNSTLITAGKGSLIFSVPSSDLEVAAVNLLKNKGYQIQKPSNS